MPRCKLEKLVDNPSPPRKYTRKLEPTIDAAIEVIELLDEDVPLQVPDFSPAIGLPLSPVTIQPVKENLKKLAGTPFLVDIDTGLVYLQPDILKALKNN